MGLDTDFNPVLLVVLALPGFVALGIYDNLVPSARRTAGKSLLEVVLFGTLNAVITAPLWAWIYLQVSGDLILWDARLWLALLLAGIVVPSSLGVAAARLPKWNRIRHLVIDPTPTSWDAAMENRNKYYVRFHMRDGRVVGGYFGDASFASSYPQAPDMYVQELWFLDEDGSFLHPAPGSRGVVIRAEDCCMIELLTAGEPNGTAQAATTEIAQPELAQPEHNPPRRLPAGTLERGAEGSSARPESDPKTQTE